MLDCAGRKGNFLFVGEEDAVGAGVRRLGSRKGQGRVGNVEGWEVGEVEDKGGGEGNWDSWSNWGK